MKVFANGAKFRIALFKRGEFFAFSDPRLSA
jgi:hypothetical protein